MARHDNVGLIYRGIMIDSYQTLKPKPETHIKTENPSNLKSKIEFRKPNLQNHKSDFQILKSKTHQYQEGNSSRRRVKPLPQPQAETIATMENMTIRRTKTRKYT